MTVELTGADPHARRGRPGGSRERDASRSPTRPSSACGSAAPIVERVAHDGTPTYGVTTGVGMRRGATVDTKDARAFNRSAIFGHLVGLGEPAPEDVVRASLLRLANAVASGHQGGRPEVAARADRGAQRRRGARRAVARHRRAGGSRAERRPRPRRAAGCPARGRRGDRSPREQRFLDRAVRARGRRRALTARLDRPRRGTRLRGVPCERRRSAPRGRGRPPVPGDRRDARHGCTICSTAARSGNPAPRASSRTRSPSAACRRCTAPHATRSASSRAARDRAERAPGQPARRAGRATARLGRELRLAAARGRARLLRDRARPRAHGRRRAHAEAPEPALQRPDRGTRRRARARGRTRSPSSASPRRRSRPRRGSWRSRSRSSSRRRCRQSGVEDRTTLSSLGARRLDEMVDLGARVAAIELMVAAQAVDLRGGRALGTGAALAHASSASASRSSSRTSRCRFRSRRSRATIRTAARTRMTTYDVHQHLWPESFVARPAGAHDAAVASTATCSTTLEGRFAVDLGDHELATRSRALDRDGIDVAVLSLQPSLGLESLPDDGAATSSRRSGWTASARSCRRDGRFRAFSPCARARRLRRRLARLVRVRRPRRSAPTCSTRRRPPAAAVFVHPDAGRAAGSGAPGVVGLGRGYPARMQEAYLAWLAVRPGALAGAPRALRDARRRRAVPARAARAPRASTSGPPSIRTCSSTSRRTAGGRSSSASRRSASGSSSTAATRRSSIRARHWMPSAVSAML